MEKKFNCVYITTNLINGKQYVGDHSTNNLNDNYLGSGLGIKNAIIKYGKENFKKEILEQFETKQEAFNAQEKYIIEYNTLCPYGYNNNKRGGCGITGLSSEEKSLKLSNIHKGKHISEEHKQAIRVFMKTYKHSKETKKKLKYNKTNDHKKKLSNSKMGNKNPMFGKSLYQIWLVKYGEEIAKEKMQIRGQKIAENNRLRAKI